MYLDHSFARKTFAQRIGSAKVKSGSEVAHLFARFGSAKKSAEAVAIRCI